MSEDSERPLQPAESSHTLAVLCFREHMSADSLQKREEEDATFAVQQQQHKAVMDETDTLYNELIMSYQSAHHCWVRQPRVGLSRPSSALSA